YGSPDNTARPGGVLTVVAFPSRNTSTPSTFRFMADDATVGAVVAQVGPACGGDIANVSLLPSPYTSVSRVPLPEQAVQYYRGSSAVLTLNGYNNTALFSGDPAVNASAAPLPPATDLILLSCLNSTIGAMVPLVQP
ncbi:hypothetical protein K488DRAFT_26897, partial [Vararia minispora EC-137]